MDKKYIYLDIDGVLITYDSLKKGKSGSKSTPDPKCIINLNKIIKETGADIILSSSWGISKSLEEMSILFKQWGIVGNLVDKIPNNYLPDVESYKNRQYNIFVHCVTNSIYPEKIIILDDTSIEDHCLEDRWIKTSLNGGLLEDHVNQAIRLLNGC